MDEREELLESLDYLNGGIKAIENLNAKKISLANQANQLGLMIQSVDAEAQRAGMNSTIASEYGTKIVSGGSSVMKTVGTIAGVIVGLIIWGFFGLVATVVNVGSFASMISGMGLVFGAIVALIIIVISRKGSSLAKNASNKAINSVVNYNNKTINNAPEKIAAYRSQYNQIVNHDIPLVEAEMYRIYKAYEKEILAFAPDYRYSACIDKMIFYIRNMRADTIKEAINMYVQEVYQNQVLSYQEKQTYCAAVTAAASIETARNTGRIADNTEQMIIHLQNIEQNTARTAQNTEIIADNTYLIAQSAAYTAKQSGVAANHLSRIERACTGGW